VDLAYLSAHPETIDRLIEHQRIRTTPIHAGANSATHRLTLDDGTDLFAKSRLGNTTDTPADIFQIEARCLRWLGAVGAPVPAVIAVTTQVLVLEWIEPGEPQPAAAEHFGHELARLHQQPCAGFGAPWSGYLAGLPLPNQPLASWPEFYVERRCLPYLRMAFDAGTITQQQLSTVERTLNRIMTAGWPSEAPARIHGDLWGGNILFGADGHARLIDPAAYGGGRELDLACLALFPPPYLAQIMAGYQEAFPLLPGWEDRVKAHQLHMLLTHCVLFGHSYVSALLETCQRV
jgi:fructosamine-3-kinase